MKRSVVLIFVFLFFACFSTTINTTAQARMDSLKANIVAAEGNDSLQAERYIDLAFEILFYTSDDLEEGINSINKAIALSKKKPHLGLLISEYNYIGSVRREQGRFNESVKAYEQALSYAKKQYKSASLERKKVLDSYMAKIKGNMANVYVRAGKSDKALKIRLSVIDDLNRMNDKDGLAAEYGNIASDYIVVHKYHKAIAYAQKGIAVYAVDSNNRSLPFLYGNLGISYSKLNRLDSALHYFILCRNTSKYYKQLHLDNEADIAKLYAQQKKYDLSNQTFENLFAQYDINSENNNLNYYKILAAESYLQQGNFLKASKLFEEAKKYVVTDNLPTKIKFAQVGSKVYRQRKDYEQALKYSDLYHEAKDSLYNTQRDSTFHLIESKYNVVKKQEVINKQKIRLRNYGIGLISLLGLALIGGLLFFNYKRQKDLQQKLAIQENKAKEAEIDNLKKENKLISMQSMLEGQEEERKRIAQDLHDNIGTLMTTIKMKFISIQEEIESIQKMNIAQELDNMISNASNEVRRISHRMTPKILEHTGLRDSVKELEIQLQENGIEVKSSIEVLEHINNEKLELNLYRILQEVFSNIAKHSKATKVSIVAQKKEDDLIIRVRDNGMGLSKEKWESKKTLGLQGIKDRVEYLNGEIKRIEDDGMHLKMTIPLT